MQRDGIFESMLCGWPTCNRSPNVAHLSKTCMKILNFILFFAMDSVKQCMHLAWVLGAVFLGIDLDNLSFCCAGNCLRSVASSLLWISAAGQ